jgi:hypothetical protein
VNRDERRCHRLLLAYPAAYRAERGDEILDTLLASGGSPGLRERLSLLVGGLRVRSAQNRRLPTRVNLRLCVLFGLAVTLAQGITTGIVGTSTSVGGVDGPTTYSVSWPMVLTGLAGLLTALSLWFGPRALGGVAACGTAVLGLATGAGMFFVAAAILAAALNLGRERMPRLWLLPFGLMACSYLAGTLPGGSRFETAGLQACVLVVLLLAFVDARPALGVCVTLLAAIAVNGVTTMTRPGTPGQATSLALEAAIVCAFALPLLWRTRRQARL